MPDKLSFDAIVVGGGPSGIASAIVMAGAGLKVALFERGRFTGSKNLFGGVLYTSAIKEILPGFETKNPPFERPVTEQGYWLMSPDGVVRMTHRSEKYKVEPALAYTGLRARFDEWFGRQAEAAGALVIPKTTVIDVIRDTRERVIGVRTDRPDGDAYAPVTILSEGVNNLLTQKLGMAQGDLPPRLVALSVKEVIGLPQATIEQRFGLTGSRKARPSTCLATPRWGCPGPRFYTPTRPASASGWGCCSRCSSSTGCARTRCWPASRRTRRSARGCRVASRSSMGRT